MVTQIQYTHQNKWPHILITASLACSKHMLHSNLESPSTPSLPSGALLGLAEGVAIFLVKLHNSNCVCTCRFVGLLSAFLVCQCLTCKVKGEFHQRLR